jgi:hypothetical protein
MGAKRLRQKAGYSDVESTKPPSRSFGNICRSTDNSPMPYALPIADQVFWMVANRLSFSKIEEERFLNTTAPLLIRPNQKEQQYPTI